MSKCHICNRVLGANPVVWVVSSPEGTFFGPKQAQTSTFQVCPESFGQTPYPALPRCGFAALSRGLSITHIFGWTPGGRAETVQAAILALSRGRGFPRYEGG